MKICYLGLGSFGYSLATLLASKGLNVTAWTTKPNFTETVKKTGHHPLYPNSPWPLNLDVTNDLEEATYRADCIIESVTTAGIRSVCEKLHALKVSPRTFVITSKGIEQDSGLLLPSIVEQVLGDDFHPFIGCLSGPGYAQEILQGYPATVVASGHNHNTINRICKLFTTPTFRVYPNNDLIGVSFGGALKNIIAIACGISDGLNFGSSSRAALMTRGLHEIRKLATAYGAQQETINGLAGMGDLCLTCSSSLSRNFQFGILLAQGFSTIEALKKVGTVVEGAYTCVTATQLSKEQGIPMPITETVYQILHEGLHPKDAVALLMQRTVKEEHL